MTIKRPLPPLPPKKPVVSHEDILACLDAPPGTYVPKRVYDDDPSEKKRIELSIIMGCCVVVRSFDERPRRVSQEVASGMDLMRETLGKMDVASLKIQAPDLMRSLIKMGAKLCPVPLLALKSLAFALVDAGVIGIGVLPQEKADLQMEECRKALRLVASEMATMMGTPTVVRQELISGN